MRRLAPIFGPVFGPVSALICVVALAGCNRAPDTQQNLAAIDAALIDTNSGDPALTAALRDQIMVDPALTQSSNANAVRPPPRPDPLSVPEGAATGGRAIDGALTLGAMAEQVPGTAGCAATIRYSAVWATRLPATFPLYPGAAVAEAAGNDSDGCALRIVSFAVAVSPGRALGWYADRARKAGYSVARRGDAQVAGRRGDASYVVYARPRAGGGADLDMIVDSG